MEGQKTTATQAELDRFEADRWSAGVSRTLSACPTVEAGAVPCHCRVQQFMYMYVPITYSYIQAVDQQTNIYSALQARGCCPRVEPPAALLSRK